MSETEEIFSKMLREIVTFETAKLAKENGFNWACNYMYEYSLTEKYDEQDGYSGPFGWKKGECKLHCDYMINNHEKIDSSNKNWYICAAPTRSLLQAWLREEHKIHITIFSKSQESWMYRITKPGQDLEEGEYGEDYNSYEDALEAGLQKVLNIISDKIIIMKKLVWIETFLTTSKYSVEITEEEAKLFEENPDMFFNTVDFKGNADLEWDKVDGEEEFDFRIED